jgi:hypothetical protein
VSNGCLNHVVCNALRWHRIGRWRLSFTLPQSIRHDVLHDAFPFWPLGAPLCHPGLVQLFSGGVLLYITQVVRFQVLWIFCSWRWVAALFQL